MKHTMDRQKKVIAICVWGTAGRGKTSTIRKVFELLAAKNKSIRSNSAQWDIHATAEYKGKKIGFCSQGDPAPYNNQCSILEGLINEGCDIVVCASRTKGETVNLITRLFDEVIWVHNLCVEPYEGNEGVAEEMNILSAKSIIKLLG
jgi:GTPase SAR1 family protein